MDSAFILPLALIAAFVAMLVTSFEMRASLTPASCSECPHCRQLAEVRQQRELELQKQYARSHGLDSKDDDERI
jgi:hypothetical protein